MSDRSKLCLIGHLVLITETQTGSSAILLANMLISTCITYSAIIKTYIVQIMKYSLNEKGDCRKGRETRSHCMV